MAVIDVGPGATNRAVVLNAALTFVDLNNPANATGSLDIMEVWLNTTSSSSTCGTFEQNAEDPTKYTSNDYEVLGSVTSGSKQTFSGLDCAVETGNFLGLYNYVAGKTEGDTSGYNGVYYNAGDKFGAGETTYSLLSGYAISIYATGTTAAAAAPMQNAIPAVMALLMN